MQTESIKYKEFLTSTLLGDAPVSKIALGSPPNTQRLSIAGANNGKQEDCVGKTLRCTGSQGTPFDCQIYAPTDSLI